jgi:hypothetical protein
VLLGDNWAFNRLRVDVSQITAMELSAYIFRPGTDTKWIPIEGKGRYISR